MANASAMCTSFKKELLQGFHVFDSATIVSRTSLTTPTKDTFKGALILATGSAGAASTNYSSVSASEVGTSGSYTTAVGGIAITNVDGQVVTSSTSGVWTPSASWTTGPGFTSSGSFDCLFIHNSSQGNKAVSVHVFTAQSITVGTFTLTMPTNDSSTALLRLA